MCIMGTVLVGFVCFVRYEKIKQFVGLLAPSVSVLLTVLRSSLIVLRTFSLCVIKAEFKWTTNDIYFFYYSLVFKMIEANRFVYRHCHCLVNVAYQEGRML